jgi:hypothetical protein
MPKGHCLGFRWTTAEERFWKHVHKTDGCWEWTGYSLPFPNHPELRGHGQIRIDDRAVYAHRFSYELHNGPIAEGVLVLHRCDNRACVRPDHLFEGSHKDNTIDAMRKGRMVLHPENLTSYRPTSSTL